MPLAKRDIVSLIGLSIDSHQNWEKKINRVGKDSRFTGNVPQVGIQHSDDKWGYPNNN